MRIVTWLDSRTALTSSPQLLWESNLLLGNNFFPMCCSGESTARRRRRYKTGLKTAIRCHDRQRVFHTSVQQIYPPCRWLESRPCLHPANKSERTRGLQKKNANILSWRLDWDVDLIRDPEPALDIRCYECIFKTDTMTFFSLCEAACGLDAKKTSHFKYNRSDSSTGRHSTDCIMHCDVSR